MISITDEVILQSLQDLTEDSEELEYLSIFARAKIDKFISEIGKAKKYLKTTSYNAALKEALRLKINLEKQKKYLETVKQATEKSRPTLNLIQKLSDIKNEQFELIRIYYGISGSIVTSLDWQSPSFAASLYSHAGKQTGKIKGTINDYKRDVHLDEKEYEEQFLKEYIDAPFKLGIHVYMTASGQSAFTTILNFLLMEGKINGKVILGKSSYFQYKQLLISAFSTPGESTSATPGVSSGPSLIEIDESDTEGIIQTIKNNRPGAIFLDSLCNAKDIPVPDLPRILDYLTKEHKQELNFIIDNTCLSIAFQPFKKLFPFPGKIRLFVFESLMKYHHFGLDRATGGIIASYGGDTQKLFDYRKHSGTNITDASVYMFPLPNRKMLEQRLKRFQRNASYLSFSLRDYLLTYPNGKIEKIVYPGQGSFFNVGFKKKNIGKYKQFINIVISEAKKRGIQIVGGTSFGLNNTRIYLTSLWTKYGEPFVRVSVGTENRYQLEILKEIFESAIDKI
jgi:cystathionine beta-lyase/cystathionine gamma-synthase